MFTVASPTSMQRRIHPRRYRGRYWRVLRFFAGLILNTFLWDITLRRIGLKSLSKRTAPNRYQHAAQRFRALAVQLGGVWIKAGQFLSARLDILPESITSELAYLQDEVGAEPFEVMRHVLQDAFGRPVEELFRGFEEAPLASASLGQVHRARLPEGDCIVVKIQRPGIDEVIKVDLAALRRVIGWLRRYRPITRRVDLDALFDEFSRTLWEEIDYLAEADNARRFAALYADDPAIRIPRVYADLTTRHVLTLEDVYFIKITEYAEIERAGINRVQVADRLFRTYLQQIFIEGFFHADPHPGNLFVEPLGEGTWRLVFVDFGMVGQVGQEIKSGLRELAIAVGTRDLDRMISAYTAMGVILPGTDLERLRQAEAALFERLWGKNMTELIRAHPQEMRRFAGEFRDLLYEMPFQLPADLLFLGRCVAILSGMCTGLDPEFNLFEGLQPFASQLLSSEGGDWFSEVMRVLAEQGRSLLGLPLRLDRALTRLEKGDLTITARAAPGLERQLSMLTLAIRKLVTTGIFAAFLIAGSLLYSAGERTGGWICFGFALVTLLWTILTRRPGG